ncbi:MAG: 3-dehydroquinate synthase [Thermoanaerobaculia bacterium]
MHQGQELDLFHERGSTRLWIGPGAFDRSRADLGSWLKGRRVFVVTSAPVRRLHGRRLTAALEGAVSLVWLEVADGEDGKSLAAVEQVTREMIEAGGKRDSRLVTFGGGSVGDVGGFVASCFLRGIEYAHVPTTLLAQVDASIGGKTGVNLPQAKNSIGAFHQPRFVVSDSGVLSTLPREQIRQGLFEVVKAAILADAKLFALIEQRLAELLEGEREALSAAVEAAVAVKVAIVAADEREGDRRRLLNLGHTLGHALETTVGHGLLAHGDAVGHGMLFAVELARRRRLADQDADRMRSLVERMEPVALPELDREKVLEAMGRDKKARESGLSWVLPIRLGAAEVVDGLDPRDVEPLLASYLTGSVESA